MRVLPSCLMFSAILALACGGPSDDNDGPEVIGSSGSPQPDTETQPAGPQKAWMVIGQSSSDKARAQELFDAYKAAGHPAHGDFPKFVESTGIEGLKPNFWLVVVAMAPTEAIAREIERKLELRGQTNAYVREVVVTPDQIEQDLTVESLFPPELQVARFVSEGDACVWQLIDPVRGGKVLRELGRIPKACSAYGDYQLAMGPKGRAIVEMDGIWQIDVVAGSVTPMAAPGGSLDGVGFAGDGTVIAYTMDGELKEGPGPDGEPTGWMEFDGNRVEIEHYDPYEPMGYELCHEWKHTKGGWKRERSFATTMAEGTIAPFCPGGGDKPSPLVYEPSAPWRIDPHGTQLSTPYEDGKQPSQLVKQSEYDTFGEVEDCGLRMAMGVTWLEGESYSLPVLVERDDGWHPLEGMPKSGSFDWRCRGDYMIACGGKAAGVYKSGSGKAVWTGDGTMCPIWWD